MADDGIGDVAALKIVIDAETEKFANGIAATRETLARFVGDSVPMLGKLDGLLGGMGDVVGALPGKFAAVTAAITPWLAGLQAAYATFQMAAEKIGLDADIGGIDSAFGELFATLGIGGPNAVGALERSSEDAKIKLTLLADAGEEAGLRVVTSFHEAAEAVAESIRTLSTSLALMFRAPSDMSNDQLAVGIKTLKAHIAEAEETGKVSFQNLEAFGGAFGEVIEGDAASVVTLTAKMQALQDELQKRAANPADMTKYIEGLERANDELKLRMDTLDMEKSEAEEYLAIERAKLEAVKQGKEISDADLETIKDAAKVKRDLIGMEEEHNETKKKAAEEARQEKARDKALETLEAATAAEVEQLRAKVDGLGKSAAAMAENAYVQKHLQNAQRQGLDLADEEIEKIKERGVAIGELTQQYVDAQEEIALAKKIAGFDDAIDGEIEQMKIKLTTLGKTDAAVAEATFYHKHFQAAQRQGIDLSEAEIDGLKRKASEFGVMTQRFKDGQEAITAAKRAEAEADRERERNHKGIDNANLTMEAELEQLRARILAVRENTIAGAEEAFVQKQLTALKRQNIELTDEDIEGIRETGRAYADLLRTQKSVVEQAELMKQMNQAVSQSIMSEFSSWTRGAEFDVKRMTANILAEFAKIALQRYVLNNLFGGGGVEGGGLMGNLLGGVFGGFKAEGGAVETGKAYIVGEKGPELFAPSMSGFITPNHALGGMGGGNVVHLSIDARGSTSDSVAALRSEIPSIVLETMNEHTARTA